MKRRRRLRATGCGRGRRGRADLEEYPATARTLEVLAFADSSGSRFFAVLRCRSVAVVTAGLECAAQRQRRLLNTKDEVAERRKKEAAAAASVGGGD